MSLTVSFFGKICGSSCEAGDFFWGGLKHFCWMIKDFGGTTSDGSRGFGYINMRPAHVQILKRYPIVHLMFSSFQGFTAIYVTVVYSLCAASPRLFS